MPFRKNTMMTSREIVKRAVRFETPERLPRSFPEPYGSDTYGFGMEPSPDARPRGHEFDEWGAEWDNIGICKLGEVQGFPLKDWADFDKLSVPDIREKNRFAAVPRAREEAGDKFLMAGGISLYERVHFIRGLENTWADIYLEQENLCKLIDILVDMNLYAIEQYAQYDFDGYLWCDDWGLQDRLMINPESWHEIWQPRYAKVYSAAHDAGLLTMLHSCGYIVDILDGLIDAGLDVIQMDQQQNMGLELLSERFGGRIAFWCPVDIQNTMARGRPEEIRAYVRKMTALLGRREGGFICGYYGDPAGAGHTQEAIDAMCDEFLKVSDEMYTDKTPSPSGRGLG